MKNQLLYILIFALSSGGAFGGFSDKGITPLDMQWWECRVGMVIQCNTEECPSICASKLAQEKEEREMQRLEDTKEVIRQGTEEATQDIKSQ